MKYLFSFLLLLASTLLSAQEKDTIILRQGYDKIKTLGNKATYSKNRTFVQIKFAKKFETSKLNDFKITTDGANIRNTSAWTGGKISTKDATILEFDLTPKIDGIISPFKLAILENGKPISPLIEMTEEKERSATTNPPSKVAISYRGKVDNSLAIPAVSTTEPSFNSANHQGLYKPDHQTDFVYTFNALGNKLYYPNKTLGGKDTKYLHIKVGQSLRFDLLPVPNPMRYEVSISSDFKSNNIESDEMLEKFLFNPVELLGKTVTYSADDSKEAISHKEGVLGYLQQINTKLTKYLNEYRYKEAIDPVAFMTEKKATMDAVHAYLSSKDTDYPGNIGDYLLNEFVAADSIYLRPVLKTIKEFDNFVVTPIRYDIKQVPNHDELLFDIRIKPKNGIATAIYTDTLPISLPIFGGFKIDVSPGLFYSFHRQHQYTLRSDSTAVTSGSTTTYTKFKTIVTEDQPRGNIGFSTLLHFYSRWGKDVNVALSLGPGLTLDESPQLRYLVGGSVIFGRSNRIALSGGYSFGKIKKLSGRYTDNKTVVTDTTVETYSVLKGAGFVALSYNIPFIKRKKTE